LSLIFYGYAITTNTPAIGEPRLNKINQPINMLLETWADENMMTDKF